MTAAAETETPTTAETPTETTAPVPVPAPMWAWKALLAVMSTDPHRNIDRVYVTRSPDHDEERNVWRLFSTDGVGALILDIPMAVAPPAYPCVVYSQAVKDQVRAKGLLPPPTVVRIDPGERLPVERALTGGMMKPRTVDDARGRLGFFSTFPAQWAKVCTALAGLGVGDHGRGKDIKWAVISHHMSSGMLLHADLDDGCRVIYGYMGAFLDEDYNLPAGWGN